MKVRVKAWMKTEYRYNESEESMGMTENVISYQQSALFPPCFLFVSFPGLL